MFYSDKKGGLQSETRRKLMQLLALAPPATLLFPSGSRAALPTSVRIDRNGSIGKIPVFAFGFSMEKNLIGMGGHFSLSNEDFVGCCHRLGQQVFRIGGDHGDKVLWDPQGRGGDERYTSPSDIDTFAAFVKALGWKVIYGLNLAQGTPETTADEGKVVAGALGDALMAFEIGNEPNLYVLHGLRPIGYDFFQFLNEWQSHAQALRKAVPNARISGPGAFNQGWRRFGVPFAKECGSSLYMLTSHYYRGNGQEPGATIEALIDGLPTLFEEVSTMVAAARDNGIPAGFRMVETSTFFGGGADGVSDAAVSALWALEYGLRSMELGASGLNFQLGPPAHSNTALAVMPGGVEEVRPEFYGLSMLAELGPGDMLKTEMTGAPDNVTVHAMRTPEGRINVVLINMTNQASSTEIVTGGVRQMDTLWLRAPSLAARQGLVLGEGTIGRDGSGVMRWNTIAAPVTGSFIMDLPPASAVCIKLPN